MITTAVEPSVRQLLDRAEHEDGYLAACAASPRNRAARTGCSYLPFLVAPGEADRLLALADSIPLIRDADLVILHPSAENGYPHTRPPNLICLPSKVLRASDESLRTTLLHEMLHLHQRRYPDRWNRACRADGWTPLSPSQIPRNLQGAVRLNPDTLRPTQFWAWEEHHCPLPLFSPRPHPTLGDVVIKWYDLRNGSLYSTPPPSFEARYGSNPAQPEHPYELLAVELADKGLDTEALVRQRLEGF
jgi:hypothetical protein